MKHGQRARFRIGYYFISDSDYPRNRRIREYLESLPDVEIVVHRRSTHRFRLVRLLTDVVTPFLTVGRYDAAFVAEYAINFALFHTVAGKMRGVPIIVDGFVSKVETLVEDWHRHRAKSPVGLLLRLVDWLAVVTSDLYLTDTELRARRVRQHYGTRYRVLSLPVGAPSWAKPLTPTPRKDVLRVLFYGLYVPLHGVDTIIKAQRILEDTTPGRVALTLVGDGALRPATEELVDRLGLGMCCSFREPVPETSLPSIIAEHDVVLGVFGDSAQAASVIPNKVWQGLACGRTVITRRSEALDEIADIAGDQLVMVSAADPGALADALRRTAQRNSSSATNIAARLEASTATRFDDLGAFLKEHGL